MLIKSFLVKKMLKSFVRSGKIFDVVEIWEIRGVSLKGKLLLIKLMLSVSGVYFNSLCNNDLKEVCKKVINVDVCDLEMLFDGSVNLDLDLVEIQLVVMGSLFLKGEKEKEIVVNLVKIKGEVKGESLVSKIDVLLDGREVENDVCLMEIELENEGDVFWFLRYRSILWFFMEDDFIDDENECVRLVILEEECIKIVIIRNRKQKENVEEYIVFLQSEFEVMFSRSILEKMGKEVEDDELKLL